MLVRVMVDIKKIKLVIWDLDETFWRGILSEGTVEFDDSNAQLIRDMTDTGVINSICSKNDEQQVAEFLKQHGIADLFVFNSINWAPKGPRIRQIVTEMNLRAPNVLFIDDNLTNLGEAVDSCPEIMTSNEDIIPLLKEYYSKAEKRDTAHKRLKQYRVLEEKQSFRALTDSNDDFLRKCNIRVEIKYDCLAHIERIADLVLRTNQLNFTKVRSSTEELETLLSDSDIKSGYVEVQDRFGDYGIVGFFAVKNGELIHFVFSCRTLNMGVEQYVYHEINTPKITVVGEVSSRLDTPCPDWINVNEKDDSSVKMSLAGKRILIKGPCDMQQMFSFIKETGNIITEFTFVNNRGVQIEQGNHTTHIVESITLGREEQRKLEKTLPFGDPGMFRTALFDSDIGAVTLSMFMDPNLGLYQDNTTGAIVAFGEYTNDLTNPVNWSDIVSGRVFTANCKFKEADLEEIKRRFTFLGRIKPEESVKNLDFIYHHMSNSAVLVLCLGSETPFEGNSQPAYADRHLYHQELNRLIRAWAIGKERVRFLDVNEFIQGQSDFTNNINHFQKQIYYHLSERLVGYLNSDSYEALSFATEDDKRKEVFFRKLKKIPNKIMRFLHGSK